MIRMTKTEEGVRSFTISEIWLVLAFVAVVALVTFILFATGNTVIAIVITAILSMLLIFYAIGTPVVYKEMKRKEERANLEIMSSCDQMAGEWHTSRQPDEKQLDVRVAYTLNCDGVKVPVKRLHRYIP